MFEGALIRSLTQVIGPPDGLGAVPALQKCSEWAAIWLEREGNNQLPAQLIHEISNTLHDLENTNNQKLKYFPEKKRNGENVFKGHSLSTAPLWSITPIVIKDQVSLTHFNQLAAAYLSWVITAVNKYIDLDDYSEWIHDHHKSKNPSKPILSAVHEAALSIRRLVEKSSVDLIKNLSEKAWDTDRHAFQSILLSLDPADEDHKRVKRLRSLFHLALGYRPLHRRRTSVRHVERMSNIKTYTGKISSTYYRVEIPGQEPAFIHTPIIPSEDIYGEDIDTISLVGVDLTTLIGTYKPGEDELSQLNIRMLYAKAAQKAKHIARSNHYEMLNPRRIHPEELRSTDRLVQDVETSINDRMTILITILTGRSIENIRKYPAEFVRLENGLLALKVSLNKPKIGEHPDCIKTEDSIYSPFPARWLPVIEQFHTGGGNINNLSLNRTTNGINRILKKHFKSKEITASKLHKILPIALLDSFQDDGIASLIADPLTSISTTKNHYICISKEDAVGYFKMAWSTVVNKLDGDHSISVPHYQDGYVGSANNPKIEHLRQWMMAKPSSVGTWENEFFEYRKQIIKEGLSLAHRGITDPNPIFSFDPNPDLKSGLVVINDKDRGGKGQMTRLAVAPSKLVQAMRCHNERTADFIHGSRSLLFPTEARTPSSNATSVIRPKELVETEPRTPFPANGPRKLFRSSMIGKIPGELADAIMGWQTHGLVPFSEFSSLSPYILQAYTGKHVTDFFESLINGEESNEES